MKDFDDILSLVVANERQSRPSTDVLSGLEGLPIAPLAKVIIRLLDDHPRLDAGPILKAISDLNQGRLEDLDRPDFQSYVIATVKCSQVELVRVKEVLRTSRLLQETRSDTTTLLAARDESLVGGGAATATEIAAQLRKRVR
jgi:hypothetical protein